MTAARQPSTDPWPVLPPGALPPAPRAPRSVGDGTAVLLAVAAAAGAWWHPSLPLAAGLAVTAAALAIRRPGLLVVGAFVVSSALGVRAHDGLAPVEAAAFDGVVTLVSDPREAGYALRADARVGSRRVELEAANSASGALDGALAGERLHVRGRLGPPPADAPWLVPRHVVGVLRADRAERVDGGSAPWRAANRFRRVLERGAEVLPDDARVLYGGIVLGDRRGQGPELVDDFRGTGLSHLLVVSGQNVAFVLVLVSPVLARLRSVGRWAATLAVIGFFALVTRFEPSVLRASAMAAIAVTGVLAGRPVGSVRALSLAVAALVVVDPLLVHAVGFQLSVAASAGIALLGRRLAAVVPGPRPVRDVLGITLAAQLGVAPVLVPTFGGLPVVSVVANLLTVPVKGLVITWGMPAGLVAGLAPPAAARVLHAPTGVLVTWVGEVARVAAALPLGELDATGVVLVAAAGWGALVLARLRPGWHWRRRGCVAVAAVAVLAPAWSLRSPPAHVEVADGVHLHRGGGVTVLVVDERRSPRVLLEGLRRAGVRRIDLVVGASEPPGAVLDALRHRWPVGRVVAGEDHGPVAVRAGPFVVDVVADGPVTVHRGDETARGTGTGAPPRGPPETGR